VESRRGVAAPRSSRVRVLKPCYIAEGPVRLSTGNPAGTGPFESDLPTDAGGCMWGEARSLVCEGSNPAFSSMLAVSTKTDERDENEYFPI